MAKDLFHEAVKTALVKEGWIVTDDPYSIRIGKRRFNIDLGAEKVFAAQREKEIIAVEVKSFLNPSPIYDFHQAVGQYINYFNLLHKNEPDRKLFVAIPIQTYQTFLSEPEIWELVEAVPMPLIIYDDHKQEIHRWITFWADENQDRNVSKHSYFVIRRRS